MGLCFRDIEYNGSSPIYSYLLKDVYFRGLNFFPHVSGRRSKTKRELIEQISSTSVPLSKMNNVYQGLPAPPQLVKQVSRLDGKTRHWILGYHDLDEPAVFVVFPAGPDIANFDEVRFERDLKQHQLTEAKTHPLPHSFFIDRLYIWLYTINIKDDQKNRFGVVFDVPHIFLERKDIWIRDSKVVDEQLHGEIVEEIVKSTINKEDLPVVKLYHLFHDETGLILYLRDTFQVRRDPNIPEIVYEPKGCEWRNKDRFDMNIKDIVELGRRFTISEWLVDR